MVIIDLARGQVVSIEPYIVGEAKTKWAWTQNAVTVTDTDGLASYYELRKADNRAPAGGGYGNSMWGGGRGRGGGRGPGLFGWLFQ